MRNRMPLKGTGYEAFKVPQTQYTVMRDTDSPVEYTGNAHMVTVSCPLCDNSQRVSGQVADENDGKVLCSECHVDNLWSDMYVQSQPKRLRKVADYLEYRGKHTKAEMFRSAADDLEKWEPVIRGFEKWKAGDFAELERAIESQE